MASTFVSPTSSHQRQTNTCVAISLVALGSMQSCVRTQGLALSLGPRFGPSLSLGLQRPSSLPLLRHFSSQLPDADVASIKSSFEHSVKLVQAAEPTHYAAIQLAPHRGRAALFALRALHLELKNIFEGLTETQAQLMRYQWWRDTIDGVYAGESSPQPVVQVLDPLIAEYGLEQKDFQRMISSWEAAVHRYATPAYRSSQQHPHPCLPQMSVPTSVRVPIPRNFAGSRRRWTSSCNSHRGPSRPPCSCSCSA
jgi:hypothetical protein